MTSRRCVPIGLILSFGIWTAAAGLFAHGHSFSDEPIAELRYSSKITEPGTDRLVIILTDSVPFDMAFDPHIWPKLSSLRKRATWGRLWTAEPTMTSVMVHTILTGAWPTTWTVIRDWRMQKLPHETWVDGLVQSGRRGVAYGDIPWSEQVGDRLADSYTIAEEGKTPKGQPIHWESKLLDMSPRIVDAGISSALQEDYDVLIWHVVATDQVMHLAFRDSAMTKRVLGYIEDKIYDLLDDLDDGRTTFLLLSDHGCAANGRHGTQDPEARSAYWMLFGRGATAGLRLDARQTDLAATILALFGLSPNAPSEGRILWEALDRNWKDRALCSLNAVRQRIDYLERYAAKARRPYSLDQWKAELAAMEASYLHGDYRQVCITSSRILEAAATASRRARRANDSWEALAWWIALGLLLLSLFASASSDRDTIGPARTLWMAGNTTTALLGAWFASRTAVPILVALSSLWWLWPARKSVTITKQALAVALAVLAAYLVGVTILHLWTGRLCNTIIFQWTKNAESWFVWAVDSLALGGLAALFLLRKRILPSLAAHPVAWIAAASIILVGSNGYYQGFYFPFVLLLWVLLLWTGRDGFPGKTILARSARAMGPLLAAAALFFWQTTWDRHFFHLRYWLDAHQATGGLLAAISMMIATAAITWNASWLTRKPVEEAGPGQQTRTTWLLGMTAALLLAGLHGLHPSTPEHLSSSLGAHLIETIPGQATAMGLLSLLFATLKGWRSPSAIMAFLVGLTALSGSPFEATATGLLLALLLSLVTHPVFTGPYALPASLFTFLALRVGLHILFDFKFNFTGIHDLMGFPSKVTWQVFLQSVLVGLIRFLPATFLAAWAAFGRLAIPMRTKAVALTMTFLASKILFILILMHLSRFQLYLNWRNTGEAIYYGIWISCLLVYGLVVVLSEPQDQWRRPGMHIVSAPPQTVDRQ